MCLRILVLFILIIRGISLAQDQATIELPDSVVVYGSKTSKVTEDINSIDINQLSNLSLVNYDLFSSLSLIGASYQNDFNVIPLLEGADFQEQEFLIESMPSSYPINLLGIQSGLNSLLFSSLNLEKNQEPDKETAGWEDPAAGVGSRSGEFFRCVVFGSENLVVPACA